MKRPVLQEWPKNNAEFALKIKLKEDLLNPVNAQEVCRMHINTASVNGSSGKCAFVQRLKSAAKSVIRLFSTKYVSDSH